MFKLLVFDLDETLWTIQLKKMDPMTGPFTLVDPHEAVSDTASVRLFPGVRALLSDLENRGRYISLASRSDQKVCEELLRHFEIEQYFRYPQYGWQNRGQAVLNVIKAFRENEKEVIAPAETLFVDDYAANIDEVKNVGAKTLLFGRDVSSIKELGDILQ